MYIEMDVELLSPDKEHKVGLMNIRKKETVCHTNTVVLFRQ